LKTLDVGYGYTADGGKTFPFRGKGVGLMPLARRGACCIPAKRFLIHIKSNDPAEGEKLSDYLARACRHSAARARGVWRAACRSPSCAPDAQHQDDVGAPGNGLPAHLPWVGWFLASCAILREQLILVPRNYGKWLWGWPDPASRIACAASPARSSCSARAAAIEFSSRIDTAEAFARRFRIAGHLGIWTNRIDRIAPLAAAVR